MKITLLPGDGIGVEIVDAAVEVLDAAAKKFGMTIEYDKQLIGGAAIDATGVPLPEATIASAKTADAVLLGAVGGPKCTWRSGLISDAAFSTSLNCSLTFSAGVSNIRKRKWGVAITVRTPCSYSIRSNFTVSPISVAPSSTPGTI